MTSRVQKGGPVFRPVVKSRTRLETRQSLVVGADGSSADKIDSTSSLASISMPPPTNVPSKDPPLDPPENTIPLPEPITPNSSTSADISLPSIRPTYNTPRIQSATPPIIGPPTRITPVPPSITSQPRMGTPITPLAKVHPSNSGYSPEASQATGSSHLHVLHHSGVENVPRLSLDSTTVIKPQRPTRKKKTLPVALEGDQTPVDLNSQPTESEPAIRPTRRHTNAASSSKPKRKSKSATISENEGSDDGSQDTITKKRKRRASSGTPRPRRSRAPSLPPFDPDADPGEEIDPTVVTMASLCSDTGQGRVSRKAAEILSNHAAWKASNREKRARMKILMELKKYGREEETEETNTGQNTSTPTEAGPPRGFPGSSDAAATSGEPAILDDTGSGFDYTQDMATSRFNVQVRIGPNGETIIDEESLVVDRAEAEDTTGYTHVVESDHTKFVNSGSYGKRYRGSRWSAEETEMFYDALSQYGENYELIAYVLPGRDRKSCKNKFKAEDKKNPTRINYCLSNNTPVDMATLSRMTGKDFSGPVPEIRVPTPQPLIEPAADDGHESPVQDLARKKSRKKKAPDDGVVIVGQADSFVPFPDSP